MISSLREQFLVREMETEGAAPSAGAADRHELAGAFDNVILDLRSSKGLATQPGGGPIAADKVSSPLPRPTSTCSCYWLDEGLVSLARSTCACMCRCPCVCPSSLVCADRSKNTRFVSWATSSRPSRDQH